MWHIHAYNEILFSPTKENFIIFSNKKKPERHYAKLNTPVTET